MTDQLTDAARIIASDLQGTCMSLTEALERAGLPAELELNIDFCNELDQLVFECENCGWWYELSEMSETKNYTCTDCEAD